jgi:predicted short-subunit dehydrogenase-like oxidoreductase (DUF2520 family)
MIPELMFRLPIISGSSLVAKGFFPGVVEAVVVVFFCSVVFASGLAGFGVVVCPTATSELAMSDAIKTKALVAREKLFISETSKEIDKNLRPGDCCHLRLFGAQSMMLGLSGQVARHISKVLLAFDAPNIRGSRRRVNKTGTRMTTVNKPKPEVSIVGTGRLGTALAIALAQEGYSIGALVSRRRENARRAAALLGPSSDGRSRVMAAKELADRPAPELLLIATPDDQIASVAKTLAKLDWDDSASTVLHTSGALSSDVLAPLRESGWSTGSLHPLVSVSEPKAGAELLRGAFWCVEGDKRAVRLGRAIVRDLDGKSFSISSENKPLYHAAAVMASGNVTALFDVAIEMLGQCGLSRKEAQRALLPLLASAVRNLEHLDPSRALTGTFARGDLETVKRHLQALKNNESALDVYRLLGLRSLDLAASRLDPAVVKRIRRLIG